MLTLIDLSASCFEVPWQSIGWTISGGCEAAVKCKMRTIPTIHHMAVNFYGHFSSISPCARSSTAHEMQQRMFVVSVA